MYCQGKGPASMSKITGSREMIAYKVISNKKPYHIIPLCN